jgi:hypothetical protein
MERLINFFWIVLFCGALAFEPISFLIGHQVQSPEAFLKFDQRPRSMLPPPGIDRASMQNFFRSFESFFCDRLPYRERLLRTKAKLNLYAGKFLNPDLVILGKDGWLFFGNAAGFGIDQYRGLRPLNPQELDTFKDYFEGIQRELDKLGIPFLFVIAPDKHEIYPEKLPRPLSKRGNTPMDQILSIPRGFRILDLRPSLLEKKVQSATPLYYKTDSHWNEFGAYLAYRSIMDFFPSFPPVDAREEDFINSPVVGAGDLAIKVGASASFEDSLTHIRRDFFTGRLEVENLIDGTSSAQSPVVMNRVSQHHCLKIQNSLRQGSILIFTDSFIENATRYFNNTFGVTVYQHYKHHHGLSVSHLASKFRPDAVLFLMVERNLAQPVSQWIPAAPAAAVPQPTTDSLQGSPETVQGKPGSTQGAPSGDQSSTKISSPLEKLFSESKYIQGIKNISVKAGSAFFSAVHNDPYFELPRVPEMKDGAAISVELTVPAGRLVQLYFQTTQNPEFTEKNSLTKSLPAGRHRIEWSAAAPLNGLFRFDPGNGPGDYQIHKILFSPLSPPSPSLRDTSGVFSYQLDKLFKDSSFVSGITNIRSEGGELFFTSTCDDPYFHLPAAPAMPRGATLVLEITIPQGRLVQIYYETTNKHGFAEKNSSSKALPAGRHTVELPMKAPLTGIYRLDPGNGPGEYRIHSLRIRSFVK